MHVYRWLLPALLVTLALGSARAGEDPVATAPEAYDLGEIVKDLEGPGPDGETVKLSDLTITKAKAEAAVLAIAEEYAEGEELTLASRIETLPGVLDDGELDEEMKLELIARAGQTFGLVPSESGVEAAKTLQDLVAWILAAEKAPILVMVWSPRCPMCKNIYDERVQEILGETGVRLLAVAGNFNDTVEHVTSYLEGNGYYWKVIVDPEQKITDRLGGLKTPHLFLLDADHKLLYRGTVDNDPRDLLEEEERKDYFRAAIEAVKAGSAVEEADTAPQG